MNGLVRTLSSVLQSLLAREQHLNAVKGEPSAPGDEQFALWRQSNLNAIEAVEQAISCIPARTIQEATIQALIAEGALNNLSSEAFDLDDAQRRIQTARRLMKSALPVIASTAGIDLDEYGGRRYGHSVELWPFAPDTIGRD